MKIQNSGRLITFIIIIGMAIGAYRFYQSHGSLTLPSLTSTGGGLNLGGSGTELTLLTTASKAGWLQDQVDWFNTAQKGKYYITLQYAESRQAMQDIIAGKTKPTIWSPSSPIWISRLSEYTKQRDGKAVIDPDDMNSCRTFLRTPLVILTTRDKRNYLTRLFTSPQPWSELRELSLKHRAAPWGEISFSHADPLVSNSGMLTVGLMLSEYADHVGGSKSLEDLASDPGFIGYLSDIEHGLKFDNAAKQGSQPLVNEFADNPSTCDFITAYESSALGAAESNSDLCVIYPNPTIIAEQQVGVLKADWVTSDQAQGAQLFMQQLAGSDSLKDALKYHMRPYSSDPDLTLSPELVQHASQGFSSEYRKAIEMPPYAALNQAAYQWRIHVAHQST